MNTSSAKLFIEQYLKEKSIGNDGLSFESRCLFLDGPWGVGKTYLIKSILKEFEANNPDIKVKYMSLAGVSSIDEIEDSLGAWYYPKWSWIRKRFPHFNLGLNISVANFGFDVDAKSLFSEKLSRKITNHKNKYIIVFDEIDRKCDSLDLNAVFALAMSLSSPESDNDYHRVILISNDEAFTKEEDISKINSFRNKVSKTIITLNEPDKDIYKTIYKNNDTYFSRRTLMNTKRSSNLRIHERVLEYFSSLELQGISVMKKTALLEFLLNVAENEESSSFKKRRQEIVKYSSNVTTGGNAYELMYQYLGDRWLNFWYTGPASDVIYISFVKFFYPRYEINNLIRISKRYLRGERKVIDADLPFPFKSDEKESINLAMKLALNSEEINDVEKLLNQITPEAITNRTIDPWLIALGRVSSLHPAFYSPILDDLFKKALQISKNEIPPMEGFVSNMFKTSNTDFISKLKNLERTNLVPKAKEKNNKTVMDKENTNKSDE